MIRRHLFRNLDPVSGEGTFAPMGERRLGSKRHLEMVYEICVALMQSLEVDEICERIVSALLECLKRIDHVCICLVDQVTGVQRHLLCHSRDGKITHGARESVNHVIDLVIRDRKPLLRQDTRLDDPEGLSKSLSEQHIKSIMCIPLLSNRVGILGAICVLSRRESKGFRRDDTLFLTSLSTPAALAIENAILYTRSVLSEETLKKSRDFLRQEVEDKTSELLEANLRLRELSITDGLTNLYNHRYLMKMIDLEYRRALRYDRNLALLMVDADNFKYFNDNFGHTCGDRALKHLARLLKSHVRGTDIIGRYGGDEMMVILQEVDKETAMDITEKLMIEIRNTPFFWDGRPLRMTVSIGMAHIPDEKIQNWKQLLKAADEALYRAKRSGKDKVVPF